MLRTVFRTPGYGPAIGICAFILSIFLQSCSPAGKQQQTPAPGQPDQQPAGQQGQFPLPGEPRADQPVAPEPAGEPVIRRPERGSLLSQPMPEQPQQDENGFLTTETGLQFQDQAPGSGPQPQYGQRVFVHYTGWLTNGQKFDSSLDKGQPFNFVLGAGEVIRGWDEGVSTMRVGGRRRLVVPPQLGYGDQGAGGIIPPGATLVFDVELLGVQ